jgi:adenylylsulfate kinase-like enzyme
VQNLPGVDVEYETPEHPDLEIDVSTAGIDQAAEKVLKHLKRMI